MSMQVFLKVRGNTGSLTEINNRSLTAELIYQCVIFLYLLQHLIAVQSWPDAGWFSAGQRCPVLIHVLHQDQRPLGWSHCQSVWGLTQKNSYRCTMSPAGRWCWCQRRLTGGWTWLKQCQLWPREHRHGSWGVSLLHLGDDGHVHTTLSEPYEGKTCYWRYRIYFTASPKAMSPKRRPRRRSRLRRRPSSHFHQLQQEQKPKLKPDSSSWISEKKNLFLSGLYFFSQDSRTTEPDALQED